MKKCRLAATAILCLAPLANANADTLLGIYAGAQGWNTSAAGGFSETSTGNAAFNLDTQTNTSLYVALEHMVPLVPNVKVNYTTLDSDGVTDLNAAFEFDGNVYSENTALLSNVDMDSTDLILYYELFDNDLFSFDLGINGKYIEGTFFVEDTETGTNGAATFKGIIPMAYSRIMFSFPFTGLSAYAEGSYLSFDDHKVQDLQAAVTYSFIESLALDMTLQVGYRDVTIDIEDLDDIYADLSYDGVFAGLEIHF
ncbi:TIGR04219 family outer membrane beta-barrel protein [Alteromonas gilva]|uniref:TIGR04219 family outer membrane beta-barrel protein n=1 Tax=Alteromonas gilva TaxID=2987522 RepID=A0ABT5L5K1_9ALTE|nr:TIGR04219 family outer membrane beta-barrel protein [Alteromonas gilva]MDC8832319.1 TIGR04219 family outer membrane beta-barrel protein [Alteromonas gilva]